jgi:hypothetical protein
MQIIENETQINSPICNISKFFPFLSHDTSKIGKTLNIIYILRIIYDFFNFLDKPSFVFIQSNNSQIRINNHTDSKNI